ncbi:MAG: hypothetical protein L0Y71_20890 [Gemmataceae bacterium]|nr:hypothetical protein [Gemmataceae bacterium]
MLTPEEIQRALHASRVVPLDVAIPHGPLGLEQNGNPESRIQLKTQGLEDSPWGLMLTSDR